MRYNNIIDKKYQINYLFDTFFKSNGYIKMKNVPISSGIDDSVTFIGSGISTLKPILLEQSIDNKKGNYILQKAIRTHSLKNIYELTLNEFNSFFDAYCVLVNYNNLENLITDTIYFLTKVLNIHVSDILFRINSSDTEFINYISRYDNNINVEIDTEPLKYYRHHYGLDHFGIYGRNFNIAIKSKGIFKDIGNIIIIETMEKKYGVELALGAEVILMRINDLPTTLNASYISELIELDSVEKLKYADCLVTVANLQKENIKKIKHRYPIYLYNKYLKALKFWEEKLNIPSEQTNQLIELYLRLEYNEEIYK